jgi:hypothetical protein
MGCVTFGSLCNGYVDTYIHVYYHGLLGPSIPAHYNVQVEESIHAYYDKLICLIAPL